MSEQRKEVIFDGGDDGEEADIDFESLSPSELGAWVSEEPAAAPAAPVAETPPDADPTPGEEKPLSQHDLQVARAALEQERQQAAARNEQETLRQQAARATELEEEIARLKGMDPLDLLAARTGKSRAEAYYELAEAIASNKIDLTAKAPAAKPEEQGDPKMSELEKKVAELERQKQEADERATYQAARTHVSKVAAESEDFPAIAASPRLQELATQRAIAHYQATGQSVDFQKVLQDLEGEVAEEMILPLLKNDRVRAKYLGMTSKPAPGTQARPAPIVAQGLTHSDSGEAPSAGREVDYSGPEDDDALLADVLQSIGRGG